MQGHINTPSLQSGVPSIACPALNALIEAVKWTRRLPEALRWKYSRIMEGNQGFLQLSKCGGP
jgi:hypothetical protein